MHTPELDRLVALAKQAAAGQPDLIAAVAVAVKGAMASDADPYLLIGTLIEGVACTLTTAIPQEMRSDTGLAALLLLRDRLRSEGLI